MNNMIKHFILLFILLLSCQPACQKNDSIKPLDFKTLQSIAEENHVVGMTLLGYKDGDVRFIYNYGYSDLNRKIKVDDNTIFFMASISKVITGIAIMKLIEEGKIKSIEEDISKYLGYTVRNPKYPEIPVTIRQLMTHTSGINDNGISNNFIAASYSEDPPSMKELFTPGGLYFSPDIWLNAAPGTRFEYSNFGTVLAGAIVGKVSGKRFDEYINEEILKPLGMRGGFIIQNVKNINRVAVVYMLDDNRNPYISADNYNGKKPSSVDFSDYIPGTNPTILGPHGGLRTRAKGLARIMEIFINGGVYNSEEEGNVRILNESTVDLMLKPIGRETAFMDYTDKKVYSFISPMILFQASVCMAI